MNYFVVSDMIQDMLLELDTIGQRISNQDIFLALNNANTYFSAGNYFMPTRQREMDVLIYPKVYEYPLPADISYFMELKRPYDFRSPRFTHTRYSSLVHWFEGRKTAIYWSKNVPFAVFKDDKDGTYNLINDCDSLTENGTIAVGGDASDAIEDQTIMVQGTASIRFEVNPVTGVTTITFTDMNAISLTDVFAKGKLFFNLECPSTNTVAIPSVSLKIGSSASDFYSMSTDQRYRGDDILGGWGQLGFDCLDKTETGTVDEDSVTYAQITINHGLTGISGLYRVDNLFGATGKYFQLPYYSIYNITDDAGAEKLKVTSTGDRVFVPPDFMEAYKYKAMIQLASGKMGNLAKAQEFAGELKVKENGLKALYPQQQSLIQTNWYPPGVGRSF